LNDALNVTISMSLKLKEKMSHLHNLSDVLIDDDPSLTIKLGTFTKNIKKEVNGVIDSFLSFLIGYNNMLALILNLKSKRLKLINSFMNMGWL